MTKIGRIAATGIIAVLALVQGLPGAAAPFGSLPGFAASQAIATVIDRPEIRSYQPYSGLQRGFRPTPPEQLGATTSRPRVIMPKHVAPLIGYGSPSPYTSLGYAYCAERASGTLEPAGRPYGSRPVEPTQCP